MKKTVKRPLVWVVSAFLTALFLCFFLKKVVFTGICVGVCLLGVCALSLLIWKREQRFAIVLTVLFCCFAFLGGALCMFLSYDRYMPQVSQKRIVCVVGNVRDITFQESYGTYFTLDVDSMDGEKVHFSLSAATEYGTDFKEFDRISLRGEVKLLDRCEEGDFYYWRLSRKCIATIQSTSSEDLQYLEKPKETIAEHLCDFSDSCKERLQTYLCAEDEALVQALMFGDKSRLDGAVKRDFRRVGLSHALAVSGMHLSILMAGLMGLLLLFGVPKQVRNIVCIAAVLFFMGMVGFSASVMRAGIMLVLCYVSFFFRGHADALNSLFASAGIICLISPLSVFDTGLELSFLATLGIVAMGSHMYGFLSKFFYRIHFLGKTLAFLWMLITATISAVIFTLPVMFLNYQQFSVVSLLSNLLFHPFIAILLYGGAFLLLLGSIPFLRTVIVWVLHFSCHYMQVLLGEISGWKHCLVSLRYPFSFWCILVCSVITLLLFFKFRKGYVLLGGVLVCTVSFSCCLGVYQSQNRDRWQIWYYNDNSSNDAMIAGVNDRLLLIDDSTGTFRRMQAEVQTALDQSIYTELDSLVLTHYHRIQANSLQRLLGDFYVSTVWLPPALTEEEQNWRRNVIEVVQNRGVGVKEYGYDEAQTMENGSFAVYHSGWIKRSTQPLISVFLDTPQEKTFLLPPGWNELPQNLSGDLFKSAGDCDVLILASHGPKVKITYDFALFPSLRQIIFANDTVMSFFSPDGMTVCAQNGVSTGLGSCRLRYEGT